MAYLNQPMDFGAAPNFGGQVQMPQAAPKKGGMFGSGVGAGDFIQALLAGYLAAQGNPAGMAGMQMIQQKRRDKQDEEQYQRHRGDKLADYAEMQKIQAQYGSPAQPHYFESNSGDQYAIGPDGKPQLVFQDPFRYKMVPNGMGGVVPVSIEALMGGGQGGAPTAPVGKLTPIDEGGAMGAAPSLGFPRPY